MACGALAVAHGRGDPDPVISSTRLTHPTHGHATTHNTGRTTPARPHAHHQAMSKYVTAPDRIAAFKRMKCRPENQVCRSSALIDRAVGVGDAWVCAWHPRT